jgi:hypothetical protein
LQFDLIDIERSQSSPSKPRHLRHIVGVAIYLGDSHHKNTLDDVQLKKPENQRTSPRDHIGMLLARIAFSLGLVSLATGRGP